MINDEMLSNEILDTNNESNNVRNEIFKLVEKYAKLSHGAKKFTPGKSFVPCSGRVYDDDEIKMLTSASLDFWLTGARFNRQFEKKLADFLKINFVTTTNSGSSANLLALSALTSEELNEKALKPGDEVITVAACFPTTVNPILQNNLVPVFVDIEIPTYNIDPKLIENAITEKTKAIMLAHSLGNPFDLNKVMGIAKENNLWVIEDCCDALGSKYQGKIVGTFGDISTLSFFPAHHITMGEGGAVMTNNSLLKKLLIRLETGEEIVIVNQEKVIHVENDLIGNWEICQKGYDHKYTYTHSGYNLKITDMQAAIGLAQLKKLEYFIKKRIEHFEWLKNRLKEFEEYFILPEKTENSEPAWFGFPITIRDTSIFSREQIVGFLASKLIDTRPLFAGNITRQPYFRNKNFKISGNLENSDKIMMQTFWIGVYPGLTTEMMEYVVKTIGEFINFKINTHDN